MRSIEPGIHRAAVARRHGISDAQLRIIARRFAALRNDGGMPGCFALLSTQSRQIFHFTEIRKWRMCSPSRLIRLVMFGWLFPNENVGLNLPFAVGLVFVKLNGASGQLGRFLA